MRYVRLVHFLFAFSVLSLVMFDPSKLRGAPRPGYEVVIKYVITWALFLFFGLFSVRTLLRDVKFARRKTRFERQYDLLVVPGHAAVLPVMGEGPCQMRLTIRRKSPEANQDEFQICRVGPEGQRTEIQALDFAFDKESYEVDVAESGSWHFRIEFKAVRPPRESFRGKATLRVFGGNNLTVPDLFSSEPSCS